MAGNRQIVIFVTYQAKLCGDSGTIYKQLNNFPINWKYNHFICIKTYPKEAYILTTYNIKYLQSSDSKEE